MYPAQNGPHLHQFFREMTVFGHGELEAQPDYAQIQVEVRTEGKDVTQVQQQNAVLMNRVIQSLVALNVPRDAIQTAAYSISPSYDFIDGKQVFRGYEVQNAITVKIADISQVGLVIDTAIQHGANHVSSIQFKLENPHVHYQQALNMALVNAMVKAKSMADTMRVQLQPIPVEITEESQQATPILFKSFAQEMTTPIEPGVLVITANVRVKFRY